MKTNLFLMLAICSLICLRVYPQEQNFKFKTNSVVFRLSIGTEYTGEITISPSVEKSDGIETNTIVKDELYTILAVGQEHTVKGDFLKLTLNSDYYFIPEGADVIGLTSLDVSGLTSLIRLDCYKNELTSLDVSGLTKLKKISCRRNKLTSLDISELKSLEYLSCDENQLKNLDVSELKSLEYLSCDENQLKNLNVSSLTNLKTLTCYKNELTNLDVSSLTNLKTLRCDKNELTNLDISGLTKLDALYCSDNKLTTLDVSILRWIEYFECSNNKIKKLDFSSSKVLERVECHNNAFTVCGLDSIFLSLPDRSAKGRIFITNNLSDQGPHNQCRTYLANNKNWEVLDYNDISIENLGNFGCAETSIQENFYAEQDIKAFPNPVQDILQIESKELIREVSVYDISGKLLIKNLVNDTGFSLPTTGLNRGIYVLRVQTTKELKNIKLIKE